MLRPLGILLLLLTTHCLAASEPAQQAASAPPVVQMAQQANPQPAVVAAPVAEKPGETAKTSDWLDLDKGDKIASIVAGILALLTAFWKSYRFLADRSKKEPPTTPTAPIVTQSPSAHFGNNAQVGVIGNATNTTITQNRQPGGQP